MWDLDNRTPFPAFQCFERDKNGTPHWLVFAKATFELRSGQSCLFASRQEPLTFSPLYRETAIGLELLGDVDVGFPRANTDILLTGHGRGPGRGETASFVEMSVGTWRKRIEIGGARAWSKGRRPMSEQVEGASGVWLGFTEAFGGGAPNQFFADNPIGLGLATEGERTLPRLSYPGESQRSPGEVIRVASFGPIPRDWVPRSRFAGTYDRAWQRQKAPFLPDDFDERFHQTAPEDQQWVGEMEPGLPVRIEGLVSGDLRFTLPALRFECLTRFRGQWREQDMGLQVLHVFADEARATLLYASRLEVGNTDGEMGVGESRLRLLAAQSHGFTVRGDDASRFAA